MNVTTIIALGAAGLIGYYLVVKRPSTVAAATATTAPAVGVAQPTAPGQTPVGNPLASVLLGLAAGYIGTQMTRTR